MAECYFLQVENTDSIGSSPVNSSNNTVDSRTSDGTFNAHGT